MTKEHGEAYQEEKGASWEREWALHRGSPSPTHLYPYKSMAEEKAGTPTIKKTMQAKS